MGKFGQVWASLGKFRQVWASQDRNRVKIRKMAKRIRKWNKNEVVSEEKEEEKLGSRIRRRLSAN